MSKKKHHHEEHIDESWLIPYADILTLLLALFIVLFAASQVDQAKFEQISASLSKAFDGGTGIMDNQAPVSTDVKTPSDTLKEKTVEEIMFGGEEVGFGEEKKIDDKQQEQANATEQKIENEKKLLSEGKIEEEFNKLAELQKQLDAYIANKGLQTSLQTSLTESGLLITISNNTLFDSGSAKIRAESVQLVREISELLYSNPPREIMVAGHTDNVPILNSTYPDNWALSADRALSVTRILLENKRLEPEKFVATGRGEYRPVASNQTAEGREKNRRVEVLILPNYSASTTETK